MPPTDDIQNKRERARLAMEGPKQQATRERELKTLEEKRRLAKLAMEGMEHRQRREKKEKELAEKEEMLRQVDEEVQKHKEEERQRIQKQDKELRLAKEEKEKVLHFKEERYKTSQNVIESLKKGTTAGISPIHTLKSDMAKAIKEEGLSTAKMSIKEQSKLSHGFLPDNEEGSGGKKWLVVGSLIFIILAGGGFGIFYYLSKHTDNTIKPVVINSVIPVDSSKEVDISNDTKDMIPGRLASIFSALGKEGNLTYIYLTRNLAASSTDTRTVTKKVIDFPDFLASTNSPIPIDLSRFIYNYMLGTYTTASSTYPFLAFKFNSYDSVSQEFSRNENGYVKNILAALTGGTLDPNNLATAFVDKVIKNKNTRILTDASGNTVMVYSFVDTATLIIAPNEETFVKVYTSYNSPKPSI